MDWSEFLGPSVSYGQIGPTKIPSPKYESVMEKAPTDIELDQRKAPIDRDYASGKLETPMFAPDDLIGSGIFTKTIPALKSAIAALGGAGLLAASAKAGLISGSKAASVGNQAGAFRPSGSIMFPSSVARLNSELEAFKEEIRSNRLENPLADHILSKLLGKPTFSYGTPEYPIDRFLLHVADPENTKIYYKKTNTKDMLNDPLSPFSDFLSYIKRAGHTKAAGLDILSSANFERAKRIMAENLYFIPDAKAYFQAVKEKQPHVYKIPYADDFIDDIDYGVGTLTTLLRNHSGFSDEQLQKKSLPQLTLLGKTIQEKLLLDARKTREGLEELSKKRTAEYAAKSPFKDGLVELKDEKDLALETALNRICIGAGNYNNGKWEPAWDPFTGKRTPGLGQGRISGDEYMNRIRGGYQYFSYRPNGLPEATIEINPQGYITQLYGPDNKEVSSRMAKEIEDAYINRRFGSKGD